MVSGSVFLTCPWPQAQRAPFATLLQVVGPPVDGALDPGTSQWPASRGAPDAAQESVFGTWPGSGTSQTPARPFQHCHRVAASGHDAFAIGPAPPPDAAG